MATRADSDAETNVVGHQLGCCRRCGALVADTAIHKTLYATAAATGHEAEPIEPAGAAADCGVSHACSANRRSLSGDASSLPSRGALIALWIQAVPAAAMLDHSCAVSLTSGVPGHSLPCGFVCLRSSHPGRTQWPSTTIAAMTAAVSSSGCRWGLPQRLWRARAAVGMPSGSSPCR